MSDRHRSSSKRVAATHPPSSPACQLASLLAANLCNIAVPGRRLTLAFSGGLDSRVLLQLLVALRSSAGFELHAMHVHHGLSPNADAWAEFCRNTCQRLDVPLTVERVEVSRDSGLGLEAAARQARYEALFSAQTDFIVLAHHQDDQAETLLLQLLRGSGVKGLAAMAAEDDARRIVRPLLEVPQDVLRQYAIANKLEWIEDESNEDTRYDRNYLRHEVLPVIERRFKRAGRLLARTAGHMAEAALLLDELAAIDAGVAPGQKGGFNFDEARQRLMLSSLRALNLPRARNLLRWWLALNGLEMPGASRLEDMLRQLLGARVDAVISIKASSDATLRRYRDAIYLERRHHDRPVSLLWSGQPELQLPDGSRLTFEKRPGLGLACERLGADKLRIASREGGERFKPDANRPTRTLKHLLQEADIPPWERDRIPLVYLDDALAVVPGIGVAADFQAQVDEPGLVIGWQPVWRGSR